MRSSNEACCQCGGGLVTPTPFSYPNRRWSLDVLAAGASGLGVLDFGSQLLEITPVVDCKTNQASGCVEQYIAAETLLPHSLVLWHGLKLEPRAWEGKDVTQEATEHGGLRPCAVYTSSALSPNIRSLWILDHKPSSPSCAA